MIFIFLKKKNKKPFPPNQTNLMDDFSKYLARFIFILK